MKPFTYDFSTLITTVFAAPQTPGGAGNLTLTGATVDLGIARLPEAQIVTITSLADETSVTFTVTGRDADNNIVSESFLGANASTAKSTGYFKTVTQIAVSAGTTGNVDASAIKEDGAVSPTVISKIVGIPYNQSLFVDIPGSLTATVQHTATDNTQTFANSFSTDAKWRPTTGLTAVTADASGNLAFPVRAVRVIITAYTSGLMSFTSLQST